MNTHGYPFQRGNGARAIVALKLAGIDTADIELELNYGRVLNKTSKEVIDNLHLMLVRRILNQPDQFPGCSDECAYCGAECAAPVSNRRGEIFCSTNHRGIAFGMPRF